MILIMAVLISAIISTNNPVFYKCNEGQKTVKLQCYMGIESCRHESIPHDIECKKDEVWECSYGSCEEANR